MAAHVVEVATARRGIPRRINGDVIRLPVRWCRYYPGDYERAKHDFLVRRCRAGTAALDLGAHLGIFTVVMARAVGPAGQVVAVEPTPSTRSALERTVALNALTGIVAVRSEAVSDRAGLDVPFLVTSDALSNVNRVVAPGSAQCSSVPSTTIDELSAGLDRPVTCIKIDIEGAELRALHGGAGTIERDRPALAIEVHPIQLDAAGSAAADVWSWLADAEYAVSRDGAPVTRRWFTEQEGCFEVQAVAR